MYAARSANADSLLGDELAQSREREREEDRRERREHRKSIVRCALIGKAVELVTFLLGKRPTGRSHNGKRRWGKRGSFEIDVKGRFCGRWRDFESSEHGDLFKLIMREQGLNFADAIEWGANWAGIASDYKASTDDLRKHKEKEAARAAQEADDAAKKADYAASKIANARRAWEEARAIDGTLGEKYLYETRKIQPTEFPISTRWSVKERAVICAITDDAGEVVGVQKIAVTSDGRKDPNRWPTAGGAKTTVGLIGRGAMRFPGPPNGPLCIAEGPETGLSVWAATGYETRVLAGSLIGAIRRLLADDVSPRDSVKGRRIVLCRDDDPRISPASKALKSALTALRAAGRDVRVASPFETRRETKADFNDLLQEQGVDAVRLRIELVVNDTPVDELRLLSLDEARAQIDWAVGEFFDLAADWEEGDAPPVHALGVSVGTGKTEAALRHSFRLLRQMRERGDKRVVVIAVPEHRLSAQVVARFNEMAHKQSDSLRADVWRGMEAKLPGGEDDERMCGDLDTMREAFRLVAHIDKEVCGKCRLKQGCAYRAQNAKEADLWVVAHPIIFHELPGPIERSGIAALVIDESPWQSGLIGIGRSKIEFPFHNDPNGDDFLTVKSFEGERLVDNRSNLFSALEREPEGFVCREALRLIGFSEKTGLDSIRTEWARKRADGDWRDRTENVTIRPMVALWKAVAHLMCDDGPAKSGRLMICKNDEGKRVVRVTGRETPADGWNVPTLLIDATLDIELVRPFWPRVEHKGAFDVETPYQTIRQATGRSFSKSALLAGNFKPGKTNDNARKRRNLRAVILREARTLGGKTLVVGNKAIIEALALPSDLVEAAWFNAIAGHDEWRDARLIIIVGRPMPSPNGIEAMAGALSGAAPVALDEWYQRGDAYRLKRDGDHVVRVLDEADRHPDETCERIRRRICAGEIVQALGRGRGVRREAHDPVEILVLGDTPLPLPVDEFLPDADTYAMATDLMLAEGGIAFDGGVSAAKAYPQLWRTSEAAERAIHRQGHLTLVEDAVVFQRRGPKLHVERAWFDHSRIADPPAAIEEMVGPLAMFEFVTPETKGEEDPKKRTSLTRDAEAYLTALQAALDAKGQKVRPDGRNVSEVLAVDLEGVREQFYRSKSANGPALRQAFGRGQKAAVKGGLVSIGEVGGRKFVWS